MSDDLSKVDWKEGFWEQRRIDFAKSAKNSDAIAKRMEALVRRIAGGFYMHLVNDEGITINQAVVEASAIVTLLPEPVDADLVEARRLAADDVFHSLKDKGLAQKYLSGDMDDSACIRLALAGMKAGRALERDSREG